VNNAVSNRRLLNQLLLFTALVLAVYGFTQSLPFVGLALVCIGAVLADLPRMRWLGVSTAAAGLLYFIVVFGYGIGKDMAVRDNALDAASTPPSAGEG
tara:strand:+ start:1460 stop:1753 length:294 start_codon:yes stop_codon:yes gene_type:complete